MKITNVCMKFVYFLFVLLSVVWAGGCNTQPALKDAFADDFLVGTAVNLSQIYGEVPQETAIITKQFSSVTPENILKWQKVHPEPNVYVFGPVDKLIELAQKNDMFIVGHTLVWQWQTPRWVFQNADGGDANRETVLARMKEHIFSVVGHCKGKVRGWDVVNEALDENGELRQTRWVRTIGKDFIEKAFEYAHQADPDAELYYNDFDMWKPSKVRGSVRLLKNLQAKGLRIDGVGMQGHWDYDYPTNEELEAAIEAYAGLGLKVMVTEFDLTVLPKPERRTGADIMARFQLSDEVNPYVDGLPDEMQQKLAQRYAELFSIFHKHADKISRITFWGVDDGCSWRNNWPIRGRTDYPLLFGRDYQPKPAFYAVIEVVKGNK
jgi:endo-1,4-beta-xylanase